MLNNWRAKFIIGMKCRLIKNRMEKTVVFELCVVTLWPNESLVLIISK